jgi:AraC-like DNA-binding protein
MDSPTRYIPATTAPGEFLERLGSAGCHALLEAIPDVRFFVKNGRGVYIIASRPMFLAHGFLRSADLEGHADHEFSPRYLADHYMADDQDVLRGAEILGRVELVTRHRGCPDWYMTSKTALRAPDGQIIGVFGVSRELKEAVTMPGTYSGLAPVIEHIREQYAESIELDLLARLSKYSLRSFQRHFKKVFHVTPMEYLRQFRVGRACQMLVETNATITMIAAECGFCDHSHLHREFRRITGTSPCSYRRRYQTTPI